MWIWRGYSWSVGVVYEVIGNEGQVVKAAHELSDGDHVFLAIGLDSLEVALLPVHAAYFAAVDVVFWGGDVQYGAKQLQGSVIFVVAEFPKLHRV